jgi:hypothetical protein
MTTKILVVKFSLKFFMRLMDLIACSYLGMIDLCSGKSMKSGIVHCFGLKSTMVISEPREFPQLDIP